MTEKTHFDLHLNGCGWLNRAREVKPRKGEAFLSVTIVALHGDEGDVQKFPVDCKVVGNKAKELIAAHMDAINTRDSKVFVSFRAGDLYVDTFVYERGDKAGQTGFMVKGRLLYIGHLKINGEVVYQADDEDRATATTEASRQQANEPAAVYNAPGEAIEKPWPESSGRNDDDVVLDPRAPDFMARKTALKAQGYRWNADRKVWSRAA